MEYYNGFFNTNFSDVTKDINNSSIPISNLNNFEEERNFIFIKILYKTYAIHKKFIGLSRLTNDCENGTPLEQKLNIDIKNLRLYDKFMQIFVSESTGSKKSILISKNEIIDFTNLVFNYDLVLPIKKYMIDTLIKHYSLFSITKLEGLAKLHQISELLDLVKDIRQRYSNLLAKNLTFSTRNGFKPLNVKM